MAVIIPMAKMPNNCEECGLKGLCPDYWKKIREEYTRPSWCQLDDLDATTFCGVPMEEAVEVMRMYKNGELVHLANRKTEPQLTPNYCGTCKHREVPCGDLPCDVCHGYSNYEPKTEPQTPYDNCNSCKWWFGYCHSNECDYTPIEDEPQTDCSWR